MQVSTTRMTQSSSDTDDAVTICVPIVVVFGVIILAVVVIIGIIIWRKMKSIGVMDLCITNLFQGLLMC